MPNHSCLDLALQAKEIKCPECDYVMEIWTWKDSLIYHCHECGQMAFQLCSRGNDLRALLKDADLKEKGNTCPFCDGNIVEGKKVGGKSVTVVYVQSVEEALSFDVVFIVQSEESNLERILKILTNRAILTISDIEDFAKRGGTIGFFEDNNRIRFDINLDVANETGLQISSKLLRLARVVDRE